MDQDLPIHREGQPTLWEDQPTFSVAELSEAIGVALDRCFPEEVWLKGQIRDLKRGRQGIVWFNLVEPPPGGDLARRPEASVPVVLFDLERRQVNARLREAGGAVRMEDGTEVRIRGHVRWWAPRGQLQITMSDIDPEFTLGQLAANRDRLLRKLDADGLLRAQARLPLPEVPMRLGLVTSSGSAAEHDVMDELRGSGIGFKVVRADVRVQGREAPRQVIWGLNALAHRQVDVIMLVRGGGAATDLVAFDSEQVARTIAGLPIPVITGIGHEIDRSVADEVAHTSYKTPTACAQAMIIRVSDYVGRLGHTANQIAAHARHALTAAENRLLTHGTGLTQAAELCLNRAAERITQANGRVQAGARVHLAASERRLEGLTERLRQRAPAALASHQRHLDSLTAQVRAADPERMLARGWSVTYAADGTLVRSPDDVALGTELVTKVASGEVHSTVTATGRPRSPDLQES